MAKLKWTGRSILLALALGAALLGGCGSDGGSSSNDPPGNNSAPTLTSLSPSSADAGGSTFLLTVNGTNFVTGSSVRWGSTLLPTTFVSSSQLTATVDGSFLSLAGFAQVTVLAPTTGGTSATVSFNIVAVTPVIATLNPSSSSAGSAPLTLTIDGSKFVAGSTIRWNDSDRATAFVSSTKLTAAISSADIATASVAQVTVRNPPQIGGTSNAATFTVSPAVASPVPAIASLSPANLAANVTGLAITVTGTGFVAGSVGQWNGANRATIVKSSTQLLLAPLPGDTAATGTALVTVSSAAPGGGLSGSLVASMSALPAGAVGVTDRLSVAGDSAEAVGSSYGVGAISAGGRFIAFSSEAGNLVPGDTNGARDVFVRDTCRGASSACTPSITRVSVANDGSQGDGSSSAPAMSADGRFVAFASSSANLLPGDANAKSDIFLRDTCAGATACIPSTTLVSASSSGIVGADDSGNPAISADGRFVSFESRADNLVSGDTNAASDIFLRDTCGGTSACAPSTIRVSVSSDGTQSAGSAFDSYESAISADGRFVAFTSAATNLVASDTNSATDIFVRDTCAGAPGCIPSTVRVSLDSAGEEANQSSFLPGISADGRFVVFTSWATDMVPDDTSGGHDVFVRDTCRGAAAACTPSNRRVSVSSSGAQANANSGGPATGGASISGDGRFVVFGSRATNLVSGDNVGQFEIFLYDTCEGASACVPSTKRLSAALDGTPSTGSERSDEPVISSDGRFVVFTSNSAAFLPGDTNQAVDVFLARTALP